MQTSDADHRPASPLRVPFTLLLAVTAAAGLGLTRDPNPNPVGLGLLFFASGVVACLLVLVGIVRVALASRAG